MQVTCCHQPAFKITGLVKQQVLNINKHPGPGRCLDQEGKALRRGAGTY